MKIPARDRRDSHRPSGDPGLDPGLEAWNPPLMRGRLRMVCHTPGGPSRSPYFYSPSEGWLWVQFVGHMQEMVERLRREELREPDREDLERWAGIAYGMAKLTWIDLEDKARRN